MTDTIDKPAYYADERHFEAVPRLSLKIGRSCIPVAIKRKPVIYLNVETEIYHITAYCLLVHAAGEQHVDSIFDRRLPFR